jgi:excisionase family DNA binding protein
MAKLLSVQDVARELDLSERRVRALIEEQQLPAERVGRSWLLSPGDVERFQRRKGRRGRPLSSRNAWALLALLDDERPEWVRPDVLSRLRRYARNPEWLLNGVEHSEPRADVRFLWLPKQDLPKLRAYALARSGLSASRAVSQMDVVARPNEPLDAYASAKVASDILQRFVPEQSVEDPNVILRIPELPWVSSEKGEVSLAVAAADLLDHDDPRVRRAGQNALRRLSLAS